MDIGDRALRRLGKRIAILRKDRDLTQEEFAVRFHLPLGTVRDWEQGAHRPVLVLGQFRSLACEKLINARIAAARKSTQRHRSFEGTVVRSGSL